MPKKLLLAGYFGCGNLGDEALHVGLTEGLRGADVELQILSGNPAETYRVFGHRAVDRMDLKAIAAALKTCDAMVFPGGSIFQDATSSRSSVYYSNLVRMARNAKRPVVFLGQGVGPLNGFIGKRAAVAAFNASEAIVVRDPGSAGLLRQLGVKKPVHVGADTAFLLTKPDFAGGGDFSVGGMRAVGIAPRPWGRKPRAILELFGELAKLLFKAQIMPVLIEMDRNQDGPLIQQISKHAGGKVPDIRKLEHPSQALQRIGRMEAVIAMRLHAGIFAARMDVPPYMISYDPKVSELAKLLGVQAAPPVEGLTPQRLFDGFMAFYSERERNLRVLERKRDELGKLAQVNLKVLHDSLGLTKSGS